MAIGKVLTTVKIHNKNYSIRATDHALARMKERNITEHTIITMVLSLGEKRLLELQENNVTIMVSDNRKNVAVVAGFKKNTLKIHTVINRATAINKPGTVLQKIYG
jgi:hypothetical protein